MKKQHINDQIDIVIVDDKPQNLEAAVAASDTFSKYTFSYHRGVIGASMQIEDAEVQGVATDLLFSHPLGSDISSDDYSLQDSVDSDVVNEVFNNWFIRMPKSYGDFASESSREFFRTEAAFAFHTIGEVEAYSILLGMEAMNADINAEKRMRSYTRQAKQGLRNKNPWMLDWPGSDSRFEPVEGLTELPHGVALGMYAADNDLAYRVATSAHRHEMEGTPISSTAYLKPMVDAGFLTTDEIIAKGRGSRLYTQTDDKSKPSTWEAVIDDVISQMENS